MTIPTNEEIIETHQASVWRFLVSIGCERNLADDLVQDTFLYVLQGNFEYQNKHRLMAWLLKVAKNKFLDALRAQKRAPNLQIQDCDTQWLAFEETCESSVRVDLIKECMGELTDRARRAVSLRYAAEMSRADMSIELKIAPAGVKTLLERIRAKLRDCVERKVENDQKA